MTSSWEIHLVSSKKERKTCELVPDVTICIKNILPHKNVSFCLALNDTETF